MRQMLPMMVIALLACSCGGGNEGGAKKQVTAWRIKPGEVGVATSAEAFDRYELLQSKNDQVQIQQMMLKGELFSVRRGTEVEMLDRGQDRSKVRIKNGDQAGKEGFLPSAHVEQVFLK